MQIIGFPCSFSSLLMHYSSILVKAIFLQYFGRKILHPGDGLRRHQSRDESCPGDKFPWIVMLCQGT